MVCYVHIINLACEGWVIVLIVCVCVCLSVCLSVCYCSSGRYGCSTSGTKLPTESLDVGNKTNVGFQLKTFSLRVMETLTHGESIDR